MATLNYISLYCILQLQFAIPSELNNFGLHTEICITYTALNWITLYCTVLSFTAVYCIVLQYTVTVLLYIYNMQCKPFTNLQQQTISIFMFWYCNLVLILIWKFKCRENANKIRITSYNIVSTLVFSRPGQSQGLL